MQTADLFLLSLMRAVMQYNHVNLILFLRSTVCSQQLDHDIKSLLIWLLLLLSLLLRTASITEAYPGKDQEGEILVLRFNDLTR